MQTSEETVHVNQIGENWEVESGVETLGQAETKVEAEELAVELARQRGIGRVEVHSADGVVEKAIEVK